MTVRIIHADVIAGLRQLPDESVHTIITSPPYYGLRSYGIPMSVWGGDPVCSHEWGAEGKRHRGGPSGKSDVNAGRDRSQHAVTADVNTGAFCVKCDAWHGHFGLEPSYPLYVEHMVLIMRESWRVLRKDGTVWLNLGDSYATGAGAVGEHPGGGAQGARWRGDAERLPNQAHMGKQLYQSEIGPMTQPNRMPQPGLKAKDLMMIPERVAIALQDDGWWIRSRIPWLKRNAMPESATDRPTTATEYVWLLTKSERCYYDKWAVSVAASPDTHERYARGRSDTHKYADGGPGNQSIAKSFEHMRPRRPKAGDNDMGSNRTLVAGYQRKKPVAGWATGAGDHSAVGHNQPKNGKRKLLDPGHGVKYNTSFDEALAVMPAARNRRNSDWFFETWQGLLTDEEGEPLAFIVNPAPFKEAHFATFGPKFVEPMILAGTSEKGCCVKCGAPWRRVTRKGAELEEQKRASGADSAGGYNGHAVKQYEGTGAQDPSAVKARILEGMRQNITIGWYPTCRCDVTAALPPYPKRPKDKAKLPAWRAACSTVDDYRADLCASVSKHPVAPATAMDIFGGSGTVGLVANRLQRNAVLIEIGEQYVDMGARRITDDAPLLANVEVTRAAEGVSP